MRDPRHRLGAATVGTNIHLPGGAPVQGYGTTDVHDMLVTFTPRRRAVRHAALRPNSRDRT